MKKIILCLLLVAALALAFAACGKGGDDPQGDDTTVATTEATTEATVTTEATEVTTESTPADSAAATTEAVAATTEPATTDKGEVVFPNENAFDNDNEVVYPDSWN